MEKIIKTYNEFLNEGKDYFRIPSDILSNTLYPLINNIKSIYDTLENGNDLDMKFLDATIAGLQKVKKSAKKFKSGEKPSEKF